MKYLIALTVIFGVLSLQSCKTQEPVKEPVSTQDLIGSWTLNYIDEASGTNIDEGFTEKKPTINFEETENRVHGNAGCNNYFGTFETENDHITFSPMGTTQMFCEGVNEHAYFTTFEQVKSFKIDNNQLILMDENQKEILKYAK